jgi:hypothetical protein
LAGFVVVAGSVADSAAAVAAAGSEAQEDSAAGWAVQDLEAVEGSAVNRY